MNWPAPRMAWRCRIVAGLAAAWALLTMLGWPGLNVAPAMAAEAGSWAVTLPRGPLLTTPGRVASTPVLHAPAAESVDGERIRRVSWRYEVSDGHQAVRAWLCHPRGCVALASTRGGTRQLEGLPAAGPFVLRFRRDDTASATIQVGRVQLIVNYR